MENDKGITQYFGVNLAELLSNKIIEVYKEFNQNDYIDAIRKKCINLGYSQRIELHAEQLYIYLPHDF